ncbi:M67 family metallopeptidase [Thermithiobacillus plumbiphilus]|uniref:M67 family metallopeptidase n=1 Tax=Thermithiobacillus plumbiphilus TaxID=1729899 RepID=A0ABU9DAH6_9PROT
MIKLPRPLINELLMQAQRNAGEEICGLIGAREGEASTVYPVPNGLHDPQRFVMDEAGQIAAFKAMREAGETLFAIYHSHPGAAAYPSATDLAESAYPDAYYLIISLNTKGVLEMRGFRLRGEGVEELEVGLSSY